jgi:hypothetical protein
MPNLRASQIAHTEEHAVDSIVGQEQKLAAAVNAVYACGQMDMQRRAAELCDQQHDRARTTPGAVRADACARGIRELAPLPFRSDISDGGRPLPALDLSGVDPEELLHAARKQGMVVIAWSAKDIERFGDPNVPVRERLAVVESRLVDRSVEIGWQVIHTALGKERSYSLGDKFTSMNEVEGTDETGLPRVTPPGAVWEITDFNADGEGPGLASYAMSCEATGASIHVGEERIEFEFESADDSAETATPIERPR